MYSFLFNQTYISIFVIALLVFLIMFLWRKLTILEGNYFLLEKRVNIMKKEDRTEQLSKNLEKSDAVMKEVFKNNIKEVLVILMIPCAIFLRILMWKSILWKILRIILI